MLMQLDWKPDPTRTGLVARSGVVEIWIYDRTELCQPPMTGWAWSAWITRTNQANVIIGYQRAILQLEGICGTQLRAQLAAGRAVPYLKAAWKALLVPIPGVTLTWQSSSRKDGSKTTRATSGTTATGSTRPASAPSKTPRGSNGT